MRLRPYQRLCYNNVFSGWDAGLERIAISVATGGGKTPILATIAGTHLEAHRSEGPVVLLAHRRELIKQAAKHLRGANPGLKVEVVLGNPGPKGSVKRATTIFNWKAADVLVTTVQTLGSAATLAAFPDPSLVIIDEAHRAMAGQYKKVLNALGCFSGTKTLGVTATPFREDFRSFEDVFQAIVASVDIGYLITHRWDQELDEDVECEAGDGYLMPPDLHHLLVDGMDLSKVPTTKLNGSVDFKEAELAAEMERAGAFDMLVDVLQTKFPERKGAIFAPTVASSQYIAQRMTERGLRCHHVDGTTKINQREQSIADLRDNTVRWMSNVNVFTEGFDMPDIDMVVLARPTQSRIFFRQSVGRALRPAPGKKDAIVLDVAGASDGMSLAGVESLTDTDTLVAGQDETLTALLERSDRERRGRYNRIQSHAERVMEIQQRSERMVEQMRLTTESMRAELPGLDEIHTQALPRHSKLLDLTTAAIDRFHEVRPDSPLKELEAAERFISDLGSQASKALSDVDLTKSIMRHALQSLQEDPTSATSQALITGEVRTIRGNLFGEEAERYKPGAPGDVQELKTRNSHEEKARSFARYGWALVAEGEHLYCPVHGDDPSSKEPEHLTIAIKIEEGLYFPVKWHLNTGKAEELGGVTTMDNAYQIVVEWAATNTTAASLLNPTATWRRNMAGYSSKAKQYAGTVAPDVEIPDNATSGFVADVISFGKYNSKIKFLAKRITEMKQSSSVVA